MSNGSNRIVKGDQHTIEKKTADEESTGPDGKSRNDSPQRFQTLK
jgi:hypothetical protein